MTEGRLGITEPSKRSNESPISHATTEILHEYGFMATHELVDKAGKMIGDYLHFERVEGDTHGDSRSGRSKTNSTYATCSRGPDPN